MKTKEKNFKPRNYWKQKIFHQSSSDISMTSEWKQRYTTSSKCQLLWHWCITNDHQSLQSLIFVGIFNIYNLGLIVSICFKLSIVFIFVFSLFLKYNFYSLDWWASCAERKFFSSVRRQLMINFLTNIFLTNLFLFYKLLITW